MSAKLNTKIKNSRIFNMYRYGLDEFSVTKFLKQSKVELTKAGAKGAMSLPEEFTFKAVFLSTLPPKCFPIVANWFNKNLPEGEVADLNESIDILSKAGEAFDHSKEANRKLWRTIFLNYINDNKNTIVKNFLMGNKVSKIAPPSKPVIKKVEKKAEFRELREELVLSEDQSQIKQTKSHKEEAYGFSYVNSKKLDLTYKNESDGKPIFGQVVRILENGQFFIDIKGILMESELVELTQSQAMHLFPERGSAVGFPEKLANIPISESLLGIWNVHDQANSKSARFMIDSCVNIALEIFEIPHSSGESDLVRSWLKESYVPSQGVFPVFELMDGIIIKPQSLLRDFRSYDFSSPFLGYYRHEAVKWNGKKIVLKPFPSSSFKYECIATETAVKRLFKFKSEVADLPVITNKQLQELAFLVNKESAEKAFSNSYQLISNRISDIYSIKDNVDKVIDEILRLPEIQVRIGEEIEDLKQEAAKLVHVEKNEVIRLQNDKKALEQEIAKSSNLLSRAIKKAFNDAVLDGTKALSDIAILKPFLLTNDSSHSERLPSILSYAEFFSSKNKIADFKGLSESIKLTALRFGLKENLISVFIAAAFVRGAVGIYGENYQKLIQAVANVTSAGIYSSISVSIDKFCFNDLLNLPTQVRNAHNDGMLFGDLLESWRNESAPLIVEIRGFNRIPPESIITEIFDNGNYLSSYREFIWKLPSGKVKKIKLIAPVFFVLNFAYGRSTFPIPLEYASSIPLVSNELFTINPFEEGLEIPERFSYLGQDFIEHSFDDANPLDGLVNLLKLMGFEESESICYCRLIHMIGRAEEGELMDAFSFNDGLLNFINLNSLTRERAATIFEELK